MASEDLQRTLFNDGEHAPDSQNLESAPPSLREAVAEIVSLARRSDTYTVTLAIKIAELKVRLIRGEAGKRVSWSIWIAEKTKLSRQYVYFLAKIGSSPDQENALKEARKGWREEKQLPDALSRNHKLMIRLVHKLSDAEAKAEYVALWQRYRSRAG